MHINNAKEIAEISAYRNRLNSSLLPNTVKDAFEKELRLRLSWNTNHLEGNTLSLEETIEVIEFDEVRSGHTYTEYKEAKTAFQACRELLRFREYQKIDLSYICHANAIIMDSDGTYRTSKVYIGTLAETAYLPPAPEDVPGQMLRYAEKYLQPSAPSDVRQIIATAAKLHMDFEGIHPFRDGNGRTGRLFLNQYLLNQKLLPAIIGNTSRYRQSFRYYEQSGDCTLMEHCIATGILQSYEILEENYRKLV